MTELCFYTGVAALSLTFGAMVAINPIGACLFGVGLLSLKRA